MSECRRIVKVGVRGAVVGLLVAGCGCVGMQEGTAGKSEPTPASEAAMELPEGAVWVATARVPEVEAYPDEDATLASHTLRHPDVNGTALTFLVEGDDIDGDRVEVRLPVRPNGTTAWVRRRDLTFAQTPYRITVDLSDHELVVTNGDEVVLETPVGVGKGGTPTPRGDYYVKELLEPETPDTVYGAYVFGLSGFSDVITSINEGEGAIGIHGTNDPDSLGADVSKGCIRTSNEVIREMATFIPLGTPVRIED